MDENDIVKDIKSIEIIETHYLRDFKNKCLDKLFNSLDTIINLESLVAVGLSVVTIWFPQHVNEAIAITAAFLGKHPGSK